MSDDRDWRTYNFVTGQFEKPKRSYDEPTEAYVNGWNDGMNGVDVNPYIIGMLEYSDWEAGYQDAKND